MAFHRTLVALRRAAVTIPRLSPTFTKAKIQKWEATNGAMLTCDDPVFVLKCAPDLVQEGLRLHPLHEPLIIVDSQEEGKLTIGDGIKLDVWYDVGYKVGEIDDGDDDGDDGSEWLWQAYEHGGEKE